MLWCAHTWPGSGTTTQASLEVYGGLADGYIVAPPPPTHRPVKPAPVAADAQSGTSSVVAPRPPRVHPTRPKSPSASTGETGGFRTTDSSCGRCSSTASTRVPPHSPTPEQPAPWAASRTGSARCSTSSRSSARSAESRTWLFSSSTRPRESRPSTRLRAARGGASSVAASTIPGSSEFKWAWTSHGNQDPPPVSALLVGQADSRWLRAIRRPSTRATDPVGARDACRALRLTASQANWWSVGPAALDALLNIGSEELALLDSESLD